MTQTGTMSVGNVNRKTFRVAARLCQLLMLAAMFASAGAMGQSAQLREYVSPEYGIAIGFPTDWELLTPERNEVWLASGTIRGVQAGCFVRLSTVPDLHLTTPEEFFAQMDEADFVKLNSMTMPDVKVHLWDLSFLGGRTARRIIYSGTEGGLATGNLAHQTLDEDRIITVTCFTERSNFQHIYNELEQIPASFRFVD